MFFIANWKMFGDLKSVNSIKKVIKIDLIKSIGAKYVIIGHSENRVSGDTNHIINLKIKSALKKKLKIIFCIGETLKEKRKSKTNLIILLLITKILDGC